MVRSLRLFVAGVIVIPDADRIALHTDNYCPPQQRYLRPPKKPNSVVNVKKCTLFVFSLENYKFVIPK